MVLLSGAARGRLPRVWPWALVMAAGYGLYRVAGAHRGAIAGGRGFDSTPATLVTDGPYALTRNPMYLGHLIFAAGLVGATRSPLALALLVERIARFRRRVAIDETRLASLFGDEYRAYRARVPRWVGSR